MQRQRAAARLAGDCHPQPERSRQVAFQRRDIRIPEETGEGLRASLNRPAPPRAPVVRRVMLSGSSEGREASHVQKHQGSTGG